MFTLTSHSASMPSNAPSAFSSCILYCSWCYAPSDELSACNHWLRLSTKAPLSPVHYCGIQLFRRRPGPHFWIGPASSSWAWARYWRAIGDGVGLSYGPEYGLKIILAKRRELLTKISVKFLEICRDVGVSDWAIVIVRSSRSIVRLASRVIMIVTSVMAWRTTMRTWS